MSVVRATSPFVIQAFPVATSSDDAFDGLISFSCAQIRVSEDVEPDLCTLQACRDPICMSAADQQIGRSVPEIQGLIASPASRYVSARGDCGVGVAPNTPIVLINVQKGSILRTSRVKAARGLEPTSASKFVLKCGMSSL